MLSGAPKLVYFSFLVDLGGLSEVDGGSGGCWQWGSTSAFESKNDHGAISEQNLNRKHGLASAAFGLAPETPVPPCC